MLKSIFGDLGPARWLGTDAAAAPDRDDDDDGFAATAILETVEAAAAPRADEVIVGGSPAQAIRKHFAASRADLGTASRQITMYDPASAWAGAVIKALSDAAGGPIERLRLREPDSMRLLATIERTTLARRNEETLKIYNADVHVHGETSGEIPITLMEGSHLAVVIVGPMDGKAIDAMLATLARATAQPTWHCPNLLFLLPPGAIATAARIRTRPWPAALRVQVHDEALTSASAVWNAMLLAWNQVKSTSGADPIDDEPSAPIPTFSIGTPTFDEPAEPAAATPTPISGFAVSVPGALHGTEGAEPRLRRTFDAARALHALDGFATMEGLLGCVLAQAPSGLVVARQMGEERSFDADLAAASAAQLLRSHRLAADHLGLDAPTDEVIVSAGPRLLVLRPIEHHPDLFLCALLDNHRANLALARYAFAEVEKALG